MLTVSFTICYAQEIEIRDISNNKEYLVGFVEDKDYEIADKKALRSKYQNARRN